MDVEPENLRKLTEDLSKTEARSRSIFRSLGISLTSLGGILYSLIAVNVIPLSIESAGLTFYIVVMGEVCLGIWFVLYSLERRKKGFEGRSNISEV